MQKETSDEFMDIQSHDLFLVAIRVIAPVKIDHVVFDLYDPVIADRDAVVYRARYSNTFSGFLKGGFAYTTQSGAYRLIILIVNMSLCVLSR